MQAGRRDKKITIETPTKTTDASGGTKISWATFASPWAQLVSQSGREFFESGAETPEKRKVFRILYRDGVTEEMRIVYKGDNYDIETINEIGRREGLEIIARAV